MQLTHIFLSPGHNYFGRGKRSPLNHPLLDVPEVECVAGKGLKGDRFFGYKENYNGQVTFFEVETWERLCAETGVQNKSPGVFRRNLITRGMDLNTLIGQEFEIQGVRFFATQESSPCRWMNHAFCPGAEERLKGKGGIRAQVLTSGILKTAG